MANKRTAELSKTPSGGSRAASPATSRSTETSSSMPFNLSGRRQSMSEQADSPTGSKASSPQETPKSQIDFQFLNFSHPSDAKASRARRAVRSHVTRQQHQKEQKLQQERRAKSYQGPSTVSEPPSLPQRAHAETFPSGRPTTLELPTRTVSGQIVSSPEASSASPSPTASPTHPPEHRIDPSELYPEEWHPYIPRVMDHYITNMAVDMPDLDGPDTRGLLRSRFLPFVMTDAAPLHSVMLIAASHYGRVRGSQAHAIDLLQLRGMAIREINRSLEDPVRATSDQLIAAVAKMASYEALFGDRNIFNTHMTGLLRMVSLRGGLPALGLDGLLERILLWIDSNATHIVGTHLYFDKVAFPTSAAHPRPDPRRFVGGLMQQASS